MPNIIKNTNSSVPIDLLSYQRPLIKRMIQSIKYGLHSNNDDINQTIFNNMKTVEMYNWLNDNNCCSERIQCNYHHIQETLRFLNSLKLNVNNTSCC